MKSMLRSFQQCPKPIRRRKVAASCRLRLELLEDRSVPAIFTVTNTEDSGAGSLRQAILDANDITLSPGMDTIAFNIADQGPHTIVPLAALPTITDPIFIDGFSQEGASPNTLAVGNNAVLRIVIDGTAPAAT